jgi:hypothetical protein
MKKLLIILLLLSSVNLKANEQVIVFIHGPIGPLTSFPTSAQEVKELFGKTETSNKTKLSKNIFSRFYQRHVNQCRTDGLHKYQPISDLNLIKFGEGQNKKQLKNFENLFKESFEHANNKNQYVFYTFGWDGRLDAEKRKEWGHILYKQLIKKFKNKPIQIYAHSHGGNVALNLADAEEKYKQNLKIENLVLIGIPVQENSEKLINSKIFKNIFSIYSQGDDLQTAENKLFLKNKSKRRFSEKINNHNLKQIKIECGNKRPGHWELWFYGQPDSNIIQTFIFRKIMYSPKFELFPYPVSTFIPQIIQKIQSDKHLQNEQDFYLNIEKNINKNKFEIQIRPKRSFPLQVEFKKI